MSFYTLSLVQQDVYGLASPDVVQVLVRQRPGLIEWPTLLPESFKSCDLHSLPSLSWAFIYFAMLSCREIMLLCCYNISLGIVRLPFHLKLTFLAFVFAFSFAVYYLLMSCADVVSHSLSWMQSACLVDMVCLLSWHCWSPVRFRFRCLLPSSLWQSHLPRSYLPPITCYWFKSALLFGFISCLGHDYLLDRHGCLLGISGWLSYRETLIGLSVYGCSDFYAW